jgi:hypothetical protein
MKFINLLKASVTELSVPEIKVKSLLYCVLLLAGSFLFSQAASAQLGVYAFTGTGTCPNQNSSVTTQPANAAFSAFTTVNATCVATTNVNLTRGWNETATINTGQYHQFSVTANASYRVTLSTISFTQLASKKGSGTGAGNTKWILRSSLDGYTANVATNTASDNSQAENINLPPGFNNLTAITFRLYITEIKDNSTTWSVDNILINGSVTVSPTTPANPANPTSNSPQCETTGVTINAGGPPPPPGVTWYWQTSATGTSTTNSEPTYTVTTSGTYYLRAQNDVTLEWSIGAGSVTVVVNPNVQTPVFAAGSNSLRCLAGGTTTYAATATGASNITYSIDPVSALAGNTINPATGAVTFASIWVGTTTITATANGCNGPRAATHVVTISPAVSTPNFMTGATSARCNGAGILNYTAVSANTSGVTYSLDAASLAGGNSINSTTGDVSFAASWSGTTTITASAAGCGGPKTATHTVTISGPVATPVFTGASSTRCQAATLVTYTATATNSSSIAYQLDAASLAAGNTINVTTGTVAYVAGWSGTSTITATAQGCAGPRSSTFTVTTNLLVATPVFGSGAISTRCQGAGPVSYTATATNTTGITYSLDATSLSAGNTINASTGVVTYAAGWAGTSTITASAAGCNGPKTATHTATITMSVSTPEFEMGPTSSRIQLADTVTYSATANGTTGITYSLDAASLAGGNTINATTGQVTYAAVWKGTSIITASAAGCGGPKTVTHTVSTNKDVVVKQLYLSEGMTLDRVDPVNTGDNTISNTTLMNTTGTDNVTFTMSPALCDSLVIKAGTITAKTFITVSSGTMPANPTITAVLRYGATTIITLTNATYGSGVINWTGTLASDVTVPAGQAITVQFTTAVAGVTFRIDFDSQTKPSKIDLPVSTYINILSLGVYSAAYPGGTAVISGIGGTTKYIRAVVTDPFGSSDITGVNITITPTGNTVAATSVATSGCTRTYEYVWNTPASGASYAISAVAKEGYENTVTNTRNTSYDICSKCAPVAMADSITGAGGNPIVVDVLANDYDPNNNLNPSSLDIIEQPKNGSAYISNNTIIYLPNGTYSGRDTLIYQVCDLSSPAPLCDQDTLFLTIDPLIVDICGDATKSHTYYIPYPENEAYDVLLASGNTTMPSNNLRTIISIKVPYSGMTIVWDHWEDGYEANPLNPTQSTTQVWGDGNPYNGIAPGYPSDIIPVSGNIVLDNTMPANPRNPANRFYDGKDKLVSNGQLAITQVTGEPERMPVQAIKTNVTSTYDFGQSFTIPLGENFPSRDFRYTALFIRASEDNTKVSIDKDNNGTLETNVTLNQGQSYLVDGGVLVGATVASDKPVGVELNAGGEDGFSIRNAPIFPATWYSHTYYTPVPTSDNAGDNPKDSSVVMFYNSLSRPININWYSGAPANGVITIPAKSAVRFALAYSLTSTYKFINPTGESYTAIELIDSYAPGGGGTDGTTYDWSFNLISEARLTDYTTVAWAPGGLDMDNNGTPDVNGNPIWVTATENTVLYIKYDGNVTGSAGTLSPCGLRYDAQITLNALNYVKIKDNSDNDQSGIAIYTCNGAKIAAVYGEDPRGSLTGTDQPFWDVGSTLQPFCKQKLIVASDDYATTLLDQPVTITILDNDFGFLATVNPSSVSTVGLVKPKNGTISINPDGTILYIPKPGFSGLDTFEYRVCSTPSPIVCDEATVIIKISACPSNGNQNVITGQVFIDRDKDGNNNDGGLGMPGVTVYLYNDNNSNGLTDVNELVDSVKVDNSGFYQFSRYPERIAQDDFEGVNGVGTCGAGTDGDAAWAANWVDYGDPSGGFCNNSQNAANTDVEVVRDGAFGWGIRLKDGDVGAGRRVNMNGANKAFLTFTYRRKTAIAVGENVILQVSSNNGTSWSDLYTIKGNGSADAAYQTVYNQDITSWASGNSMIRFMTDGNFEDNDTLYIGSVTIRYLKYPQSYITSINKTTLPAHYDTTTVTKKAMSISGGGSCTSHADFGVTKANITVSGTLYNDKNGLIDGVVNGNVISTPSGSTIYAYLINASGSVVLKTTVSGSGAYSFPLAEVNSEYTLMLSTTNVALGVNAPVCGNFNAVWSKVGECYGSGNEAGTGNKTGVPNASIAVTTGIIDVTNVNFGIQRLPETDSYLSSINQPRVNDIVTLNGLGMNPPILSGSDPEDCLSGCVLTTKAVTIDEIPVNAELYYDNILVYNGQTINNFNQNLFQVKITPAALGDTSILFRYSYVDAAMMKDLTPAIYRIIWLVPLHAQGLTAVANLRDNTTTIKWSTQSEQNTDFFIVERSLNNKNFTQTGNKVKAAGNSPVKREYQSTDDISSLASNTNVIYYRVKLTDIDGKVSYSNVVAVRLSQSIQVIAWPNPFQSTISLSVTSDKATSFDIRLVDVSGKLIMQMKQSVSKGTSQITLKGFEKLSQGLYMLEMIDEKSGTATIQKLLKN